MKFFKFNATIYFVFFTCFAFGQTHSPLGIPGPDYWQNQTDYKITAKLDTSKHTVTGQVQITAPANMVVAASSVLQNARELLPPTLLTKEVFKIYGHCPEQLSSHKLTAAIVLHLF